MAENRPKRADQLQFLRFLAFLNVFIYHAEVWNFLHYPATNSARIAVSFFFSLSGLVAGYAAYGRETAPTPANIARAMGRKLRRIYPLYALTMLIPVLNTNLPELLGAGNWQGLWGQLSQLLKNLLLIQAWFPGGYFSFNIVGWFLSSLLFLNLFDLPAAWLLNRVEKGKGRNWLLAGIFAGVALAAILYCGLTRYGELNFLHYVFPPARLGEYLLGMILGFLLRREEGRIPQGKEKRIFFTCGELGAMALWLLYLNGASPYWTVHSIHWLIPNLILLGIFTLGRGWVSQLFRWKPLVYLGDIAFECYLIHELVVIRYEILHGDGGSPLGQAAAIAYCLTVTIAAAALIHGLPKKKK